MLKLIILLAAVAVCYGQLLNKYTVFTRGDLGGQVLPVAASDDWLENTFLNPEHRTIILIHGHQGSGADDFSRRTKDEIFARQQGDHNVIVVDWERSAGYNYATASANVQVVANELTNFIKLLAELQRTTTDDVTSTTTQTPEPVILTNVHLVGFGLGAHVAGIAGRQVEAASLGRIGRITGLDPAGSGWGSNSGRLRATDARYVEVIHTDGSGLLANGIGTAIGQIDIYANGGSNQPGCLTHSCSHIRAWELFAASMLNVNLRGNSCSSMTQMNLNLCRGNSLQIGGLEISKSGHGIYRVNTGRTYPFY